MGTTSYTNGTPYTSDTVLAITTPQKITFTKGGYNSIEKTFLPLKKLYQVYNANETQGFYNITTEPYYSVVSLTDKALKVENGYNCFGNTSTDKSFYQGGTQVENQEGVTPLIGNLGDSIKARYKNALVSSPDLKITYNNGEYDISILNSMHVQSGKNYSAIIRVSQKDYYDSDCIGSFKIDIDDTSKFSYKDFIYFRYGYLYAYWDPENKTCNSETKAIAITNSTYTGSNNSFGGDQGSFGDNTYGSNIAFNSLFNYQTKFFGHQDCGNNYNDGYLFGIKIIATTNSISLSSSDDEFITTYEQKNGSTNSDDRDTYIIYSDWRGKKIFNESFKAKSKKNDIIFYDSNYKYTFSIESTVSAAHSLISVVGKEYNNGYITSYQPYVSLNVTRILEVSSSGSLERLEVNKHALSENIVYCPLESNVNYALYRNNNLYINISSFAEK